MKVLVKYDFINDVGKVPVGGTQEYVALALFLGLSRTIKLAVVHAYGLLCAAFYTQGVI